MQWLNRLSLTKNAIIGGAIFVSTFAVYFLTMCPTIYWEDSAAFCAANAILGIPHSPGFPIYVLLGRVFSLVPVENHALTSNLMSAFWGSISLLLLYFLMLELLGEAKSFRRAPSEGSSAEYEKWISRIAIVAGVLFFGFSSAFWLQTVRAEVYTLNIFFTLSLILLLIKWSKEKDANYGLKILILFSFVLGLSLANHPLLIITLVPAFLIFLLVNDFRRFLNLKKVVVLSSFLLIGISLYFFVPIRSQLTPAINWGRPDSLANLFTYMTRSTQPASVAASFGIPYLNRFWFTLSFPVIQFGLPVFWLAVLGAFALFKRFKRFFIFTFLVFVFNLSTATWAAEFSLRNYDLLGYLLPSLSVFTIWFAVGISLFTEGMLKAVRVLSSGNIRGRQKEASARLSHNQKPAAVRAVLCGLILLSPVFQIDRNFDECDKSSYDQAFEYADQILDSVKDNALIVVGDDNTLTTLWYLNYAAGKRPDVKIVSASGLTQRGYRDQLRDQYKQVHLPEMGSDNRARMGYQLCQSNIAEMPVYCQYYAKDKIFVQHLSPAGYLFEYHPEPVALSESHVAKQRAFLESNLKGESFDVITREHFGNLIFNLGVFYNHVGIPATSQEYFLWAVDIDPSNWRIYAQLGRAFLKLGLMDRAREFFQAALELDPYNQDVRRVLKDIQGKG